MNLTRVLALGVVLAVAGCSGDVGRAAGPAGPDASLLGGITLVSCSPLPAQTASASIGPEGGTIRVGPHVLTVPAGALRDQETITAILRSETVNRVEFQPTGLVFEAPATLTLDYGNCGALALLLPKRVTHVDDASLAALDLLVSLDDLAAHHVSADVSHFSSYAIAW